MIKKVTVIVPATSANLGPGFDVLGVALQLYNEFTLEVEPSSWGSSRVVPHVHLEIQGDGSGILPRDASNLVIRSASKVFEKVKKWPKKIRVKLVNRIPLSRGLGSSAVAALGGICAANALVGKPLSGQEILDLAVAMEGHPDNVVPAFAGGLCISGVVRGATRYLKFPVPASLRTVVCSPDRPLETKETRRILSSRIPFTAAVFTSSRVAFFLGAFLQKRYDWLSFAMEDVLHQPARAQLIPGIREAIQAANDAGAYGAALSGAGSSVIAFTKPGPLSKRVGEAMQKAFADQGMTSHWQELAPDNKGVRYL